MSTHKMKVTKRGFVMTGGGAKGLYEAGVIHAFHLCGMEFDVITGSSIGAINALFFAEYLLRKRQLSPEIRSDPERAVEALDNLVKAFQQAWWKLPEARIIDDSEEGPLGSLKNDLIQANIDLPLLVQLGWWWSNPQRWDVPPPQVWPHFIRLGRELVERLGDGSELFRILKRQRHQPVEAIMRAYLARFGIEQSLVPPMPNSLRDYFVKSQTPLRGEQLMGQSLPSEAHETLIMPQRTLRDYAELGVDVRLTRANYRTGRLELSSYTSIDDFIQYLEGHNVHKELTIGSSRLEIPGNPNAINAAIASGRFPGVFAPFPITEIYMEGDPQTEPENALLYQIMRHGLDNQAVRDALYPHFLAANRDEDPRLVHYLFEQLYPLWKTLPFPRIDDAYIDGGAIDNTPTNSAVDAIREAIDREGLSRRDFRLDLYVVFLHTEPNPGTADTHQNPALHHIVSRTLKIQSAAKLTSDAGVVKTINEFGHRGEELGQQLQTLVNAVRHTLNSISTSHDDTLTAEQRASLVDTVRQDLYERLQSEAANHGIPQANAKNLDDLLDVIERHSQLLMNRRLPLHVEPIEIYPDDLRLDTLQFTERLGFRQDNAVEAMTMGCYNTMWRLRKHLEQKEADGTLDAVESCSLRLARKWMGFEKWPRPEEQEQLRQSWRCQRTECAFHLMHCPHGPRTRRVIHVSISPARSSS